MCFHSSITSGVDGGIHCLEKLRLKTVLLLYRPGEMETRDWSEEEETVYLC
jgi:hypothetical protein